MFICIDSTLNFCLARLQPIVVPSYLFWYADADLNEMCVVFLMYRKYRVLRNTRSMKVLKTKSIYSTLLEFLDWLKEMKGSSDGIILAYHDHKFLNIPYFLAKAVKDYKMTEEFGDVVKGVINCARLLPEPKEATKDGKRRSNSLVGLVREGNFPLNLFSSLISL